VCTNIKQAFQGLGLFGFDDFIDVVGTVARYLVGRVYINGYDRYSMSVRSMRSISSSPLAIQWQLYIPYAKSILLVYPDNSPEANAHSSQKSDLVVHVFQKYAAMNPHIPD